MGKHRQRTSRGSGKNKEKKHTRTIWASVERQVRRQEVDEKAKEAFEKKVRQHTKNKKTEKTEADTKPAKSGDKTTRDGDPTAASSSGNTTKS